MIPWFDLYGTLRFCAIYTLPLSQGKDVNSKHWTGPQHVSRDGSVRKSVGAPDSSVQLGDGNPARGRCQGACHKEQSTGMKRTWPSETAQDPVAMHKVLCWLPWYSGDTAPSSVLMHSIRTSQIEIYV